jgi:hypothetical protein
VGPTTCALDATQLDDGDVVTLVGCTEADGPLVAADTGTPLKIGRRGEYHDVFGRAAPSIARVVVVLRRDGRRIEVPVTDGVFNAELGDAFAIDAVIGYDPGGGEVVRVLGDEEGRLPGWNVKTWATP